MKIYLEKGHGMAASMKLDPYKVRAEKDPDTLPENLRNWQITIMGTGDESLTMYGTKAELYSTIKDLVEALGTIAAQEGN